MKISNKALLIITIVSGFIIMGFGLPDWGFYGHRTINKMAVFSLPPEMLKFYKSNIDYISEHAVDPDKRRYATKHEGVRHYIDIDVWGDYPFNDLPRNFDEALIKYSRYYLVNNSVDTTLLSVKYNPKEVKILDTKGNILHQSELRDFKKFWRNNVNQQYYEDIWLVSSQDLESLLGIDKSYGDLYIEDHFSQDGIVPYYLLTMKNKLTRSFEDNDIKGILRNSAEIGHYIGDAHVPLHTTKNYNGQFTDQNGIHAFWESRLPELYAEGEYDYLVGRAEYIDDTKTYFWDMVLESHSLLPDVLAIEKKLSMEFPEDQQYCYDERLNRTLRIECPEYAAAYHKSLDGMVEKRMTDAILAIANIWYTSWIDAGMPDLDNLKKVEVEEVEIKIDPNIRSKARSHDF